MESENREKPQTKLRKKGWNQNLNTSPNINSEATPSITTIKSAVKAQNLKDPLHGITLEKILNDLVAHFGWEEFARKIKINCFSHDPSIKSSLTFLRRTPWARNKVEKVYLEFLAL